MRPPVFIFDVNETLLDLSALDPAFTEAFGRADVRHTWFLTLQSLWMTAVITDDYVRLDKLADAALQMIATPGKPLDRGARAAIVQRMQALPPHADVPDALQRLRSAGARVAALTNGTMATLRKQLKHAGLSRFFDELFSADDLGTFKPAAGPYLAACRHLRVKPASAYMVAAHAWDIAGADAAGMRTVFVHRPGKALNSQGPTPTREVHSLTELAEGL